MINRWILILIAPFLFMMAGCPAAAPVVPDAPAGLASAGYSNEIRLSWNAVAAATKGYHVYRGTNNADFAKLTSSPVAATVYSDAIASPGGDGVIYYYKVSAVGDSESSLSSSTRNMHGIRLTNHTGDWNLTGSVPFVMDSAVTVTNGHIIVQGGASLYVLDGGILELANNYTVQVQGLFRVLGTAQNPATLRCYNVTADTEGFYIVFAASSVAYQTNDNSGCLMEYAVLTNMKYSSPSGGIFLNSGSPAIQFCKIHANAAMGTGYLTIYGGDTRIRNNIFINMVPSFQDVMGAGFAMVNNQFVDTYYSIAFINVVGSAVVSGQIVSNVFDGSQNLYVGGVTGSPTIPLGGNYWAGGAGTPPLPNIDSASSPGASVNLNDPVSALSAAPAGVGPGW